MKKGVDYFAQLKLYPFVDSFVDIFISIDNVSIWRGARFVNENSWHDKVLISETVRTLQVNDPSTIPACFKNLTLLNMSIYSVNLNNVSFNDICVLIILYLYFIYLKNTMC